MLTVPYMPNWNRTSAANKRSHFYGQWLMCRKEGNYGYGRPGGIRTHMMPLLRRLRLPVTPPAHIGREKGLEPSFSWENRERPTRSSPARAILEVYYFSGWAVSNDPRPFSGTPSECPATALSSRARMRFIFIYIIIIILV